MINCSFLTQKIPGRLRKINPWTPFKDFGAAGFGAWAFRYFCTARGGSWSDPEATADGHGGSFLGWTCRGGHFVWRLFMTDAVEKVVVHR